MRNRCIWYFIVKLFSRNICSLSPSFKNGMEKLWWIYICLVPSYPAFGLFQIHLLCLKNRSALLCFPSSTDLSHALCFPGCHSNISQLHSALLSIWSSQPPGWGVVGPQRCQASQHLERFGSVAQFLEVVKGVATTSCKSKTKRLWKMPSTIVVFS